MKKKVLFVIWSFTAGGGAEKILANICNNIDINKYEIDILEIENFDIKKEHVSNAINILKPLSIVNNKKYFEKKNILVKFLIRLKNKIIKIMLYSCPKILRKIILNRKYDIEVAFNYYMPSIFVASSNKSKKICWVHSSIEDLDYHINNNYTTKLRYINQKKAFNKMDNIVAISNKTRRSIINLYPEVNSKIVNINNGFDFDTIRNLSEEKIGWINERVTIIAIGRLVEQKNFSLLIDAAEILRSKNVDFEMLIIGEGYQRELLNMKISKLKMDNYIKLIGYVNNPYPYLKKSDVICLTSIAEGFPTVIAEALILGCPFVATNVAGIEELSDGGKCGIIVETTKESIANGLETIILDNEMRKKMSSNCFNTIKRYTIDEQINKINKVFEE